MRLGHLIATFLMLLIPAFSLRAEELLINFDEAHPPYMHNKDGSAAGIYPALIKAAFTRMNVSVTLEPKPWARAILEIDTGVAGVGGIYKNSERLKKYDYSEPLLVETISIYFHQSRPLSYARIEDLNGKRIGVMRGWSYGDEFDNARRAGLFTVESVSSDEQNFQKLENGRIDVVLAIGESVPALLEAYRDIRSSDVPLTQAPAFLAFSKSSHRTALLKRFDQTIKEMRASGEFRKILAAELAK